MNLAVKYRPKTLEEVVGQNLTVDILRKQIDQKMIKNVYLLAGPSGCGKTTIARIIASKINEGCGQPIEIDAASNNGVENIREIVEHAKERAFDAEYKVYIIDECHMLTTNSWNALLKLIEEPPKFTIFIFCTTDMNKVPMTIINRCQVYKLTKISAENMISRLKKICEAEGIEYETSALTCLYHMSKGSLRQAISYLDLCKDFSKVDLKCVTSVLGDCSYEKFFKITNAILDGNTGIILETIEESYQNGDDLKLFIDQYLEFLLNVLKFITFKSISKTDFPEIYLKDLQNITNISANVAQFYKKLLDKVLNIKVTIANDSSIKETIEIMFINLREN